MEFIFYTRLDGNLSITGGLENQRASSFALGEDSPFELFFQTPESPAVDFLQLSFTDLRYIISNIVCWIDEVTLYASLASSVGLDSVISHSFNVSQFFDKSGIAIEKAFDSTESNFLVNMTLDALEPSAIIDAPSGVHAGDRMLFSARYSHDNVGIVNYKWDFGDGDNGEGAEILHAYRELGTYTVTLTVEDSVGHLATNLTVITVTERSLVDYVHTQIPALALFSFITCVATLAGASIIISKRKRRFRQAHAKEDTKTTSAQTVQDVVDIWTTKREIEARCCLCGEIKKTTSKLAQPMVR